MKRGPRRSGDAGGRDCHMEKEQREIQSFTKRLRPSARYFYRAAYAITADRQMAEYVLGEALVKAYLKGVAPGGSTGFRDGVLTVIRECALNQLEAERPEGEWDGFSPDPARQDRLAGTIAQEPLEVQRMCVLRYGCAATVREIADLLDTTADRVQEALNRWRCRAERDEKHPARSFDRAAMRAVRQAMNSEQDDPIDVGYILHAFETELAGRRRPRRILRRAVRGLAAVIAGLLFAALLWLTAVLMEM